MEATPAQRQRSATLVVAMVLLAGAGATSRLSLGGVPPAPCPAPLLVDGVLACTGASGTGPTSASASSAGARAWLVGDKLDVNLAKASELEAIPGVGPSMAHAILTARAARGRFASFEELDEVDGVGAKTLEKLRVYLVVRSGP